MNEYITLKTPAEWVEALAKAGLKTMDDDGYCE